MKKLTRGQMAWPFMGFLDFVITIIIGMLIWKDYGIGAGLFAIGVLHSLDQILYTLNAPESTGSERGNE